MTKIVSPETAAQVLIVDDHPILRHGIAQLITREADFAVCGEAGTYEEALLLLAELDVDLMLIDLSLEGQSGLDLIRAVRERKPRVRCLVLSMHDERLHAERALRAGARGYLMKQEATRKIVTALRQVRDGRIYLSESIASDLLERMASGAVPAVDDIHGLSDRELEVLQLIGQGLKTGEIANALHRSVHTIEAHRASIKRKLSLKTSGELAKAAFSLTTQFAQKSRRS